jgi:hypothetical protein
MKFTVLGLFALLSLSAFAESSIKIIGSDIGRGDPQYSKIYGFESMSDLQDGSKHLAAVILECRKRGSNSPRKTDSYITIRNQDGSQNLEVITHTECDKLWELIDKASPQNPLTL